MKKLLLLSFIWLSCTEKPEITGLWELQKVDVDMIPKGFNPTYIQFETMDPFLFPNKMET